MEEPATVGVSNSAGMADMLNGQAGGVQIKSRDGAAVWRPRGQQGICGRT